MHRRGNSSSNNNRRTRPAAKPRTDAAVDTEDLRACRCIYCSASVLVLCFSCSAAPQKRRLPAPDFHSVLPLRKKGSHISLSSVEPLLPLHCYDISTWISRAQDDEELWNQVENIEDYDTLSKREGMFLFLFACVTEPMMCSLEYRTSRAEYVCLPRVVCAILNSMGLSQYRRIRSPPPPHRGPPRCIPPPLGQKVFRRRPTLAQRIK